MHSSDLNLAEQHLAGETILIVGGGLTALRVEPTARNISGARMASDRIVPAVTKSTISFSSSSVHH